MGISNALRRWLLRPNTKRLKRLQQDMSALTDAAARLEADAAQLEALQQALTDEVTGIRADLQKARDEASEVPAVVAALDAADAKLDNVAEALAVLVTPTVVDEPPPLDPPTPTEPTA